MTETEQQFEIARHVGALKHNFDANGQCQDCMMFQKEDPHNECPLAIILDYLYDLNAMHDAEHAIDTESKAWKDYPHLLWEAMANDPTQYWGTIHATAKQRAEAFLKAIGKWTE